MQILCHCFVLAMAIATIAIMMLIGEINGDPTSRKAVPKYLEEYCDKTEECEEPLDCVDHLCACKTSKCDCKKHHLYWQTGDCKSRALSPCDPNHKGQEADCVEGAICDKISKVDKNDQETTGICQCRIESMYNAKTNLCNLAGSNTNSAKTGVLFSLFPVLLVVYPILC